MKIVKMNGNRVQEVIPDYALPVEKFYGSAFASECREAPDEVDQRWILNEDGSWTDPETLPPPVPDEPESSDLETRMTEVETDVAALTAAVERGLSPLFLRKRWTLWPLPFMCPSCP